MLYAKRASQLRQPLLAPTNVLLRKAKFYYERTLGNLFNTFVTIKVRFCAVFQRFSIQSLIQKTGSLPTTFSFVQHNSPIISDIRYNGISQYIWVAERESYDSRAFRYGALCKAAVAMLWRPYSERQDISRLSVTISYSVWSVGCASKVWSSRSRLYFSYRHTKQDSFIQRNGVYCTAGSMTWIAHFAPLIAILWFIPDEVELSKTKIALIS